MAKPNYTYLKRQKESARQKKKAEKMQRKLSGGETPEEREQLEDVVEEVRRALADLNQDDELYRMGQSLLENLPHQPEDVSIELARLFLDRARADV